MDGSSQTDASPQCSPDADDHRGQNAANEDAGLFESMAVPPSERIGKLLSTLESDVIPRLLDLHAERLDDGSTDVRFSPQEVTWLALASIEIAPALVLDRIQALRDSGVPPESLCLHLMAPAACELGRMWDEDRCSFADVTVGVGRLQQAMRDMMPDADPTWSRAPLGGRRILLAAAPGEQHTFGLSMVMEFFRKAGWDVTVELAGERSHPVDTVASQWFDVVGFSVGSHTRIDWLSAMIGAIRSASRNPALAIMVGGPVLKVHPEYAQQLAADAACSDGDRAPQIADALLLRRVRAN